MSYKKSNFSETQPTQNQVNTLICIQTNYNLQAKYL